MCIGGGGLASNKPFQHLGQRFALEKQLFSSFCPHQLVHKIANVENPLQWPGQKNRFFIK